MKVLVLTDDRIGPTMAGSALRAWEIACALAKKNHVVCLSAAPGSDRPSLPGPEIVEKPPWSWAEAVIAPVWSLPPRAFLGHHILIADGATPLLAELEAMPQSTEILRRRRTAAARIPLVAARADAILAAGSAQIDWWQKKLHPLRPKLPILDLPFGIPDQPPPPERDEIPGIPRDWAVVLWWGGVWPWLDLDTLLEARALLEDAPLSIVVPTAARPGASTSRFTRADLRSAMKRCALKPPQVVALDTWIPYHERHRILHRTSLIAVLHKAGYEADLCFRTRAMDGVWAGVPLLLTEGGEVARHVQHNGWGAIVPPGEPKTIAGLLELVLSEKEQLRFRRNLSMGRDSWTWSNLVDPLSKILKDLPTTGRKGLISPATKAIFTLLDLRRKS
ncbi:MAG: hypothetical protein DRR04_12365 [Gammaproteobacteria bacterium]|nr:MAG: hypothetical protein DRR04_12365 [Gammaproteobacteria bacterium]